MAPVRGGRAVGLEDGALFGTTGSGSDTYQGSVFKWAAGSLTTLHAFNGSEGYSPFLAPLIRGGDGALYGTTPYGGGGQYGTLFRISFGEQLTATTLTASGMATYGGTATLSATLESSDGGVADKSVTFTLDTTVVGSATTDANGVATLTGVSIGALGAGAHAGLVSASFTTDATFSGSTDTGNLAIAKAALVITADNQSMRPSNGTLPAFTISYSGFVNGDTPGSLDTAPTATTGATGAAVGDFPITVSGATDANYQIAQLPGTLHVGYSLGACLSGPGHSVLEPINTDGTSVFKAKNTVQVKFRVCDGGGASVGTAGVVSQFVLYQTSTGLIVSTVNEDPTTTTPDGAFRC